MIDLNSTFQAIRKQFPALTQKVNGKNWIYLDSAATTLKPQSVIDRMTRFNSFETANVHRGAHSIADLATQNFENARHRVAQFIGAERSEEIIFVKGTTEGINLVAHSFGSMCLTAGDEILITEMEHHANIVPWQMIAEKTGAKVIAAAICDNGELDTEDFRQKLSKKTKIVAFTACSNVLGTNTDTKALTKLAHDVGAKVLIDGAQIVSQSNIDVTDIDCDFFVFSAHKLFGPFGFGVLYGKNELLESMPPYQGGGSMISKVTIAQTTYNDIPYKFEAGTPHIEGALGLHSAIDYVEKIGFDQIHEFEKNLIKSATEKLMSIPEIMIYGTAASKAPLISFNLKGVHHSDVSQILDQEGIAVRAGHHCAQPLMARYGIQGTVRASFSIYNNDDDVENLVRAVVKAREMLL